MTPERNWPDGAARRRAAMLGAAFPPCGVWILTIAGCTGIDWGRDSVVPSALFLVALGAPLFVATATGRGSVDRLAPAVVVLVGSSAVAGVVALLILGRVSSAPAAAVATTGVLLVTAGTVRTDPALALATMSWAVWSVGVAATVRAAVAVAHGEHANGQAFGDGGWGGPMGDAAWIYVALMGSACMLAVVQISASEFAAWLAYRIGR